MTKKELITFISAQADVTQKVAEATLKAAFDGIRQAMTDGSGIQIPGFGRFTTKERAARAGRNPSTGKPIQLPATTVAVFKPASQLKEAVK